MSAIPIFLLDTKPDVLLDQRGRGLIDLRISLIDRCNFRCPYCMPADKVNEQNFLAPKLLMSVQELESIARAFVKTGVRKIRLTGGEPLLRKDLENIIQRLNAIEGLQDLALTTNGSLLKNRAQSLKNAGLNRITVSLDSLDPAVFSRMNGGRGEVQDVLEGIDAAERVGMAPIKINTVVMRGVNDHNVIDLLAYFRGSKHIVRLIEYMDVGNCNRWQNNQVVPSVELRDLIHAKWPIRAMRANYRGEVCERYEYEDGGGELGFVSSVSAPFCGDCHRARISADGKFYTCLFAANGFDLRKDLNEGFDLEDRIRVIWANRSDRYSEVRAALSGSPHVEMFQIGG